MASQAIFRNGRSFPFDFWYCRKGGPSLACSCVGIFRYDRLLQHQVLKGGKRSALFSRRRVSHNAPFISSPTIKTYPIYDFLSMCSRPGGVLIARCWVAGGSRFAVHRAAHALVRLEEENRRTATPWRGRTSFRCICLSCPCRFPPPHPHHSDWGWPWDPPIVMKVATWTFV